MFFIFGAVTMIENDWCACLCAFPGPVYIPTSETFPYCYTSLNNLGLPCPSMKQDSRGLAVNALTIGNRGMDVSLWPLTFLISPVP